MIARLGALLSLAACAHRIPAREDVEDLPPIRWPEPEPRALRREVDTGSIQLRAEPNGDLSFGAIAYRDGLSAPEAATVLDRGYAVRHRWRDRSLRRDVEVFRGSPILSIFCRGRVPSPALEVPDRFTEMLAFDAFTPVTGPRRVVRLDPGTLKPFVVLRSPEDDEGVVLFIPHPPEVRRWYLEDYVVTSSVAAVVEAGARVDLRFPEARVTDPRSTFDFALYVMPYHGTARDALDHFAIGSIDLSEADPIFGGAGYWSPEEEVSLGPKQGGLRMLRYHPAELATFASSAKLYYGHPNGRTWGDMTTTMKGIRVDPLSPRALLRDQAFRMLTFFVESGREKGAPPNLVMHPQWTEAMDDPQKIRRVVFSQYWEFRLGELERLFDSPHLTAVEKAAIYDALQAARNVFDSEAGAFAHATPNGGLWFDYLDVPISDDNPWIVNAHTTNVGNAGRFARLAAKMNRPEDRAYWRDLFVRGIDGLEHAVAQPWMWQDGDPNELRYAKDRTGPAQYHFFMLEAWVPDVARLASDLAPERVPALVSLVRRLAEAKLIRDDPRASATAKAVIAELEAL